MGLLATEQHVRTAYKAKAGWLVARAFPTAELQGLQLAADWAVLCYSLDDRIRRLGTADKVASYLRHLLHLLRADIAGSFEDPFAAGMRDLRQRLLDLGPPNHFTRFAARMEELFAGNLTEARNRERGQIPSFASYRRLREATTGLHVMFSLAELLEGFSLSDRVRDHPSLRGLATRASNIVGWANDLFIHEKAILQGEIHNLVLVLMNEHRVTVAEAVAKAVAVHDGDVRGFLEEVEQLPPFGKAAADVHRYIEVLRCCIRGHLDGANDTGRYRPFDEPAGDRSVRPPGKPATA